MGCHMWLYKKAKNLTIEEKTYLIENAHKYCYRDYVQNISRDEFIKQQVESNKEDLKIFQQYIDDGTIDTNDFQYQWAKEMSDPENVGKWYDETVEYNENCKTTYEAFIADPDGVDFIEIYKKLGKDGTSYIIQYKDEYYVNIIFDTYFRCYKYSERYIDNITDMIEYLMKCPSTMIRQYGEFDNDGKFHYFDDKNYTYKEGLTDKLYKMLEYLYKDNDIVIEFG